MAIEVRRPYLWRLLVAFDQLLNVVLLNGSEDHTISGRVGYKARLGKRRWLIAEKIINTVFWFDPNHCRKSIEWDEING